MVRVHEPSLRLTATTLTAAVVVAVACLGWSAAYEHVVGDSIWSIPPSNDFYQNWSRNRTFVVGDVLVFRFEMGFYNVVEVSRREYEGCNAENPFRTILTGPATVSLEEDGIYHFICSFGNYCLLGQKLSVAVQRPS